MTSDSKNGKSRLYEDLKRKILTLELAPGSNLDEVALSDEYRISRTPLREVFRQLAGEGYLELRDNRGAQVAPMNHKALRDFFKVAPMIYAAVSRLAAENATPVQIESLQQAQAGFRAAIAAENVDDKVFHNDRFHAIVGAMADNVFLEPSLRRLLIDHARIGRTFYRPLNRQMRRDLETAARQHDQMIAAFRAGDADRSAELVLAHWELSRKQIERFITPESFDIPLGA